MGRVYLRGSNRPLYRALYRFLMTVKVGLRIESSFQHSSIMLIIDDSALELIDAMNGRSGGTSVTLTRWTISEIIVKG